MEILKAQGYLPRENNTSDFNPYGMKVCPKHISKWWLSDSQRHSNLITTLRTALQIFFLYFHLEVRFRWDATMLSNWVVHLHLDLLR